MTTQVLGYAAKSADAPLEPYTFARRDPRPDDVVVDVLYCGVCHSDIHTARNDWKGTTYPTVPGHEIVGEVAGVGSKVTRFTTGDRVGVGCMVDSCKNCDACRKGLEQYCVEGPTFTYNDEDRNDHTPTHGGYSQRIVAPETFVFRLPDGLDLKGAAPLLCAGITTWSPLRRFGVKSGSRVAVVGLGGLGHMAIKLGKALGAEVTLFTRSPGKETDARRLGADSVVVSTDQPRMRSVSRKFDLIIDTVPSAHDVNPYLRALAMDGNLVLVGLLGGLEPALDTVPLIMSRRSVAGSLIGGIPETQGLLDYCAEHGISADVELIRMEEINVAYERMLRSDVKYRFVIDMASLNGRR